MLEGLLAGHQPGLLVGNVIFFAKNSGFIVVGFSDPAGPSSALASNKHTDVILIIKLLAND